MSYLWIRQHEFTNMFSPPSANHFGCSYRVLSESTSHVLYLDLTLLLQLTFPLFFFFWPKYRLTLHCSSLTKLWRFWAKESGFSVLESSILTQVAHIVYCLSGTGKKIFITLLFLRASECMFAWIIQGTDALFPTWKLLIQCCWKEFQWHVVDFSALYFKGLLSALVKASLHNIPWSVLVGDDTSQHSLERRDHIQSQVFKQSLSWPRDICIHLVTSHRMLCLACTAAVFWFLGLLACSWFFRRRSTWSVDWGQLIACLLFSSCKTNHLHSSFNISVNKIRRKEA